MCLACTGRNVSRDVIPCFPKSDLSIRSELLRRFREYSAVDSKMCFSVLLPTLGGAHTSILFWRSTHICWSLSSCTSELWFISRHTARIRDKRSCWSWVRDNSIGMATKTSPRFVSFRISAKRYNTLQFTTTWINASDVLRYHKIAQR